ncbi:hypothetical protein N431DRAFT_108869 [Stipitochalara longipes BDJ]|nr:hypothetical protein N431DRAFT_108869 [Stipitochalara longipes BDJ]
MTTARCSTTYTFLSSVLNPRQYKGRTPRASKFCNTARNETYDQLNGSTEKGFRVFNWIPNEVGSTLLHMHFADKWLWKRSLPLLQPHLPFNCEVTGGMPPYVSSDRLEGLVDVNRCALRAGSETVYEGVLGDRRLRPRLTLPVGLLTSATNNFNLPISASSTKRCPDSWHAENMILESSSKQMTAEAFLGDAHEGFEYSQPLTPRQQVFRYPILTLQPPT